VLDEAVDRYGPLPDSVLNLADYGRIRVMADRLGVESIDREGRAVVIKFRPQARVDPVRLVALVRQRSDLTLVPPAALRLALDGGAPMAAAPEQPRRSSVEGRPAGGEAPAFGSRKGGRAQNAPSWWTARATAGAVKPGFSKAEILRPRAEDPRAPGGVFERVGSLLSVLVESM
jgi:transcription-repair coupling factor (superfamily II helicase)